MRKKELHREHCEICGIVLPMWVKILGDEDWASYYYCEKCYDKLNDIQPL